MDPKKRNSVGAYAHNESTHDDHGPIRLVEPGGTVSSCWRPATNPCGGTQ